MFHMTIVPRGTGLFNWRGVEVTGALRFGKVARRTDLMSRM
jgi:hypothetical protein